MYSFDWLSRAMQQRVMVRLWADNNTAYFGTINGIAVEDGSGKNWLVTIALEGGGVKTIFVRAQ